MEMTLNMLQTEASVMAPPSMMLARKRGWTEMSHVCSYNVHVASAPSSLSPATNSKKNKCTLASAFPLDGCDDERMTQCCRQCGGRIGGCVACTSSACLLSEDTQRFLAEDPFDFDALPHPVLKRQQAVQNPRDCIYYAPMTVETNSPTDEDSDDDMAGEELSLSSLVPRTHSARWKTSIVGSSLTHVGRQKSGTFQPRRM